MSSKDELADFGEVRACQLLRDEGFVVERMPKNFPFYDLMATRGSCRLLVPVKTRNNTTSRGKIKTNSYNLYTKQVITRRRRRLQLRRSKNCLGRGDCRCKGKNLFRLHGRCRQTAVAKMFPNAPYSRRSELQVDATTELREAPRCPAL
jgi:hypothetical protein